MAPEVSGSALRASIRSAIDAQARVQEAARQAGQDAKTTPPPEAPSAPGEAAQPKGPTDGRS